jgi:hypothetical protein
MIKKFLSSSFLIVYALSFSACSPYAKIAERYDIKEAKVYVNEKISERYPEEGFHRFTITSDTAKDMIFPTRCAFEEKGFKFVRYGERPEMLVSVETALPYRITYMPPRESVYETRNQDGFIVQKHFSSPAYAERFFQPKLNVRIYEFQTKKLVWQSSGSGEVLEKHKDLSHQILLRQVIASLPADQFFETKKPHFDLDFIVLSEDKKNFYPKVLKVNNSSLSSSVKANDTLTEFNGQSLANLTAKEVFDILEQSQKKLVKIDVKLRREEELVAINYSPSSTFPSSSPQEYSKPIFVDTEVVYVKPFDTLRGKNPLTSPRGFDLTKDSNTPLLNIEASYPLSEKEDQKENPKASSSEKDLVLRPEFLNNLEQATHYMNRFNDDFSSVSEIPEKDLL